MSSLAGPSEANGSHTSGASDDIALVKSSRSIPAINTHSTEDLNLDQWASQVNSELRVTFLSRQKCMYTETRAILLTWESSDIEGIDGEVTILSHFLESAFGVVTEKWLIPHKDSQRKLNKKLLDFSENVGSDTLLVVYYAGHARPNGSSEHGPPIWAAKEEGTPSLDSNITFGSLCTGEPESPDVLFILDCCDSQTAYILDRHVEPVYELLCACDEDITPSPGVYSFTSLLVNELAEAAAAARTIPVNIVHSKMIDRVKRLKRAPQILDGKVVVDDNCRPLFNEPLSRLPAHRKISLNEHRRDITLTPLAKDPKPCAKDEKGRVQVQKGPIQPTSPRKPIDLKMIVRVNPNKVPSPTEVAEWLSGTRSKPTGIRSVHVHPPGPGQISMDSPMVDSQLNESIFTFTWNIIKTIHFGQDIIAVFQASYDSTSTENSKQLAGHIEGQFQLLEPLYTEIEGHWRSLLSPSPDERWLFNVYKGVQFENRNLQRSIQHIVEQDIWPGEQRNSSVVEGKVTYSKDLQIMQKSLNSFESSIQTCLIERWCQEPEVIRMQQTDEFNTLDKRLQFFLSRIALGHTKIRDLIERNTQISNNHISKEHEETRHHIDEAVKVFTKESKDQMEKVLSDYLPVMAKEAKDQMAKVLLEYLPVIINEGSENAIMDGLMRSLKFKRMNARRNNISKNHRKTFEWIFDDIDRFDPPIKRMTPAAEGWNSHDSNNDHGTSFRTWLTLSSEPVYWISGKAGSGKSTLLKFLVDSSRTRKLLTDWRPQTLILSHFFIDSDDELESSLKGLYLSMLHQLLQQDSHVLGTILSQRPFLRTKESTDDWSSDELHSVFSECLRIRKSGMCFFIDGLDQIKSEEIAELPSFFTQFKDRLDTKICVTSRPLPFLANPGPFHEAITLKLERFCVLDTGIFVLESLQSFEDRLGQELVPKAVSIIVNKANGVFLWASLLVKALIRDLLIGHSLDGLLQRLEDTPLEIIAVFHHKNKIFASIPTNRPRVRLDDCLDCYALTTREIPGKILSNTSIHHQDDVTLSLARPDIFHFAGQRSSYFNASNLTRLLKIMTAIPDVEEILGVNEPTLVFESGAISVFHAMLAAHPEVQDLISPTLTTMEIGKLNDLCHQTLHLATDLVGFIQISSTDNRRVATKVQSSPGLKILGVHAWLELKLDVLRCSTHQNAILRYDDTPIKDYRLRLLHAHLLFFLSENNISTELGSLLKPITKVFASGEYTKSELGKLVGMCWNWYDAGQLYVENAVENPRSDFLDVLRKWPNLRTIALSINRRKDGDDSARESSDDETSDDDENGGVELEM